VLPSGSFPLLGTHHNQQRIYMQRLAVGVVILVFFTLFISPTFAQGTAAVATASAEMRDAQGRAVGTATFEQSADGTVSVAIKVSGYNPIAGGHGIHVHQTGLCVTPDFNSAGEHFNPASAQHGSENPAGPHSGDLPNMQFFGDGSGDYRTTTNAFTLTPGPLSVFDADGSAIVIHASPDDYATDPSGNSGDRIGCGVIVSAGQTTTPPAPAAPNPTPPALAPGDSVTVNGALNAPAQRAVTDALVAQLQLPAGFNVSVWATDLGSPRMMAFGPDGTLYVSRRQEGDIVALRDTNGDGRAEAPQIVVPSMPLLHGLTIRDRQLYFATDTHVYVADIQGDGSVAAPRAIITDLPIGGQHPNRTLAFGPDGMLYISVGSSCNACNDNVQNATLHRANPDGSGHTIMATGLRNTLGFAWHPATGDLWGMDHGSDWRGDDQPPEELNRIEFGKNYGWPFCFADRLVDRYIPTTPKGMTKAAFCATTQGPVLTYQAHSAPIGMTFYTATQFPAEYRNDAFVAMRGSWNRSQATGYKVVRIQFNDAGQPTGFTDFLTGFLIEGGEAHFGRLAGVRVAPDGSLFVSEDTGGVIYRITYAP
jgi:glucose/arabinose dehydrogenase/Cu/Zn superoxide dismutase